MATPFWVPCGNARPGGRGQGQWVPGDLLALVCGSLVVGLGSERWARWALWATVVASVALIGEQSDLLGTSQAGQ